MRGYKAIAVLLLVILPGGFAGIWRLQHRIDARRAALHQEEDEVLVRSGRLLKIMSLEYAPLVAAIYWTRAVQYYGNKKVNEDTNLASLWPLLDVTTALDPNLIPSYRFGSTFLAEPQPRGAGRPDLAVKLLERGIRANPEYWRLYQDLGYVYYFDLKDYKKASDAFFQGSKNPKAMIWMKIMAARIAEKGESRETSRFLWSEIYNSTKDKMVKDNARVHLMLLRSDEDIDQLNEIAAEFAKRTGHPPSEARQLIEAGLLRNLPVDPQGYVYVFGPDGRAHLNPASPLHKELPLYRRPM
jgi:tetratricopeptide (TPR) repeat protein